MNKWVLIIMLTISSSVLSFTKDEEDPAFLIGFYDGIYIGLYNNCERVDSTRAYMDSYRPKPVTLGLTDNFSYLSGYSVGYELALEEGCDLAFD